MARARRRGRDDQEARLAGGARPDPHAGQLVGAPADRRGAVRPGKRLFIGVRVSVAVANALAGCAETLARRAKDAGGDLRWVAPINYHVTLAFLGWTGLETIDRVCDALAAAVVGEGRATFRTTRLGAFPSLDNAGVLWAGIEDGAALTGLARSIGEAMAALGFAREARPYHPHVTLARLRSSRGIREIVLPMAEQMFGDTRFDAVTLFESETKSAGSVYRELQKFPFRRASTPPPEPPKRQTDALERGTPDREPDDALTDDGWPRGQGPTE
ncbi:MAG: RNA 2',3'-cyclic phosphodiesterase [Deltaproteobacteria bacterium]|nr:MAG: RNA 2',3'-cyclic phosphodiesterase [Deltaproteobacteria bacterium]